MWPVAARRQPTVAQDAVVRSRVSHTMALLKSVVPRHPSWFRQDMDISRGKRKIILALLVFPRLNLE